MTGFQTALLIIFGFLLVIGVLIFAGVLPGFRAPAGGLGGTVVWWGTIPQDTMNSFLSPFQEKYRKDFTLVYVEKDRRTIESEFVDALARGAGPDIISFPPDWILRQGDKLYPIPYASLSRRTFQDTFIREGELYLTQDGTLGLPFYVDPLVLYYNKDMFANAKLAVVPKTWTELQEVSGKFVEKDAAGNLHQSAIALGRFNNIIHAKDILALLFFQAGNPLVSLLEETPQVVLKESFGFSKAPAGEALSFFNRFADPTNSLYSWNSALKEAREVFVSGNLALYLGYASEYSRLRQQNPNLNFDVTLVPQRGRTPYMTFGRLTALSVVKNSKNRVTAVQVATLLTGGEFSKKLADALFLAPARNDLLNLGHQDPFMSVFYQSAIISRGWLDPAPDVSLTIFRKLSEDTQAGRLSVNDAVKRAHEELEDALNKTLKKFGFAIFNIASAAGLVPCGDKGDPPCTFTDLMKLIENVMNFLIFTIGVPAAAIAIMIGGWLIVTAGGNESKISNGKKIVRAAVIGLVIVLGAWLIVKTIITSLEAEIPIPPEPSG
jgi:ABC-type glycerol-3-phosphate transport system substrate-binding protein